MSTFLETIRQAYESGDLTDLNTLRQGMMYQNYLDSPPEVTTILEVIPEYPNLDASSPSPGYAVGKQPFHQNFIPGAKFESEQPLRHVSKADRYLKDVTITITTRERLRDSTLDPGERVQTFSRQVLGPLVARHSKTHRG